MIKTKQNIKNKSLANIPLSGLPNKIPSLSNLFLFDDLIDELSYNCSAAQLKALLLPSTSIINSLINLTTSGNLVSGTPYAITTASNVIGTLPLATGSGDIIEVSSLLSNTGRFNWITQGDDKIYFTGTPVLGGTNLSSDTSYTALLRDCGSEIWNIVGWLSAGSIILT